MKHGFLGYVGGKRYIADWIVSYFAKHHVFVDVFGGSGSIIFEKELPASFVRVSRSHILNTDKINQIKRDKKGRVRFSLSAKNGAEISAGVTYQKRLREQLAI